MSDGIHVIWNDRQFNSMIDELADESKRDDISVLTGQAIQFLRALVFWTRVALKKGAKSVFFRQRGRARVGWWPAWVGLGVFSIPARVNPKILSDAEGSFVDGRGRGSQPFVAMTNSVPYIDKLDKMDNILLNAGTGRAEDMERALERKYQSRLRRKSGR